MQNDLKQPKILHSHTNRVFVTQYCLYLVVVVVAYNHVIVVVVVVTVVVSLFMTVFSYLAWATCGEIKLYQRDFCGLNIYI